MHVSHGACESYSCAVYWLCGRSVACSTPAILTAAYRRHLYACVCHVGVAPNMGSGCPVLRAERVSQNRNLLKSFGRASAGQNTPFSRLPLTALQVGNQLRASTTQTRHPRLAIVQWASNIELLGDHSNGSRYVLKSHARR
eukprot:1483079-Prymnesium_polylepis.3